MSPDRRCSTYTALGVTVPTSRRPFVARNSSPSANRAVVGGRLAGRPFSPSIRVLDIASPASIRGVTAMPFARRELLIGAGVAGFGGTAGLSCRSVKRLDLSHDPCSDPSCDQSLDPTVPLKHVTIQFSGLCALLWRPSANSTARVELLQHGAHDAFLSVDLRFLTSNTADPDFV